MNRALQYIIILFFAAYVLTGCRQTKSINTYSVLPARYVNYDKVKIEYSNGKSTHSIKGFIRFQIDSSLCFQFWGPLGYEVIRGFFSNGQLLTKTNENLNVSRTSIENVLGVIIDNALVQNLFLGFDSLLAIGLKQQNASVIDIVNVKTVGNTSSLSVYHNIKKKNINIIYDRKNGVLHTIKIFIEQDSVEIVIQILEVSYINKLCNFKL